MSICHSSRAVGKWEGELGGSLNCVDLPAWVTYAVEKEKRDFPKVMVRGKDQQLRPAFDCHLYVMHKYMRSQTHK